MGKKDNTNNFIINAKTIHGDKYNYSLVNYINSKSKIKLICQIHGIFEQSPEKHIGRKQGCYNCSITKKITQDEFINKAKTIHGIKYDYSLVDYKNMKSKIKIICQKHGIFEQVSGSHINQKTGCPICSKKHKYTNDEFIKKINILYGNTYCYNEVDYVNNYTKIKIKCEKHGIFEQTPSNHLSGKGCELCKTSKNENIISMFLTNNNFKYIQQHRFSDCKHLRCLPFDFYLPDYNLCIEFQGRQHYEPIDFFGGDNGFIKQQKRDKIKVKYCMDNKINLLIIKYNETMVNVFSKINNYCLFNL